MSNGDTCAGKGKCNKEVGSPGQDAGPAVLCSVQGRLRGEISVKKAY